MSEWIVELQPGTGGRPQGAAVLAGRSRLGFGAAPMGNLYRPVSDDQAFAAVAAAIAGGIGYFDTAPHYGFGLSEQRLGAALAELDPGQTIRVSTKVGRRLEPVSAARAGDVRHGFAEALPFEPVFDYGYDAVMRSFEESRRRLRRERIDILLVHDLGEATHGQAHGARRAEFLAGGYRAMRRLRDSGAVGAIGVGVNEARAAEDVLAEAELDLVLLAGRYTLLEQGALDHLLPLCAARGVGVILGGPFNSGILARGAQSGATRDAPQTYDYAPAPAAVRERVTRLERICAGFDTPLAAAALQFCLACPQAVGVIPGLASAEEVAIALALADRPIPPDLWDALRADGLIRADAPIPRTGPSPRTDMKASPLILLDPSDNVLVCRQSITAGTPVEIDGHTVVIATDIPVGHKVARRDLAAGAKVLKYGAPIGSTTQPVRRGEHIHMHNMQSDYIPAHTRATTHAGDGH